MIKVYESDETLFSSNGIKILHPMLAEVHKKDNSDYYCEFEDILDNLEYYQKGMIIRVPTPWGVQGFRCDNPEIKNNRISCKAWHLFYDSENYIIQDSNAVDKNCNDALDHFNNATDNTSPFTTTSNITKKVSTRAIRKSLYDIYVWFLETEKYGGHWYRDNWTIGIKESIGEDRGVVLAYNKNITEIKVEENWDDVCTKILPYTTDGETAILLDTPYVELSEELYDIPYTKVVKFDNIYSKDDYANYSDFLRDTKDWLQEQANSYLETNKIPKVNYSLNANIDNVSDVGDTIYVKHSKCNINITTKVISVVYDAIREKYKKIEFGNFTKELQNLSSQITAESKSYSDEIVEASRIALETQLNNATTQINNVLGNSYVIYDGDKILIVDSLPKESATKVIKISNGGIGFSQNGINGTFNSAWTIDGTMDMQQINVINLVADMIKGGTLKLGSNLNESGKMELYDESNRLICVADKNGITIYNDDNTYVKLNPNVGFAGYDAQNNKIYWADGDEFHMKKSVVEEEITLAQKIRIIPITTDTNTGIGFVVVT